MIKLLVSGGAAEQVKEQIDYPYRMQGVVDMDSDSAPPE
jgi:hypothetical protein